MVFISQTNGFRQRFPWLTCNMGAGLLAAFFANIFEAELQHTVALAFFIPVVLNLAESVSSQSVSLSLEFTHRDRERSRGEIYKNFQHEVSVGALLGASAGFVIASIAMLWLHNIRLSACIFIAVCLGVTSAAVFGFGAPIISKGLGLKPEVAAGPVALALADIFTMLVYLVAARYLTMP